MAPGLVALLRAGTDRDRTGLIEVAEAAGLVRHGETSPEALRDLHDPVLEPLRHKQFTSPREWMRSLTLRFSDPRSAVARTQRRLHIPVRYLLVQRVAAGTTGVLCLLGATVPRSGEAGTWLSGLTLD